MQKYRDFCFQKLTTIKFMAGNDGLMCKEVKHLAYTDPYANAMLDVEFHLMGEIYATHKQYPIAASFQDVKGSHEDKSKSLKSYHCQHNLMWKLITLLHLFIVSFSQH